MSLKLVLGGLLSSLWLLADVSAAEVCDRSQCKGPLKFYEDLKCKPIYEKPEDCCAVAYDCSHLSGRPADKCYANGHEYSDGEKLREEDASNPCDNIGCFCYVDKNRGVGRFTCPIVDCFPKEPKLGCYLRRKPNSCCGTEEICLENPNDRPKCVVDGKTYLEGEGFIPNNEPNVGCQCLKGYEGKNVAPFCRKSLCGTEMRYPYQVRENCAPVYDWNQSPNKNCNPFFRCQNSNDVVIHPEDEDIVDEHLLDHEWCKFGNLTLHIGDELNQSTESLNRCVECKCVVPPTLSCRRLLFDECNIKYPQKQS